MYRLLLIGLTLFNLTAHAEPKADVKVEETKARPELDQAEVKTNATPAQVLPTDNDKDPNQRSQKLSEIFESFIPSETISADNAVPFPVDI